MQEVFNNRFIESFTPFNDITIAHVYGVCTYCFFALNS